MSDGFTGRCFISGEKAEEIGDHAGRYLDIVSTTHGRYRITPGAVPGLRKLSLQKRERILAKVKADAKRSKSTEIPLISADHVMA